MIFVQKKRSATWVKKMLANGGPSDAGPGESFTPIKARTPIPPWATSPAHTRAHLNET